MQSGKIQMLVLGGWLAAASVGGVTLIGCAHEHHHHDDAVVEIRDEHGWVHKGYYDEHHGWHGGYYDEHHHYYDDPHDWHHP